MAVAPVDVVGPSPISITSTQGPQLFVPLSALQFNGSTLEVKPAWSASFDAGETQTLLALATALAAAGELTAPPIAPPSPAIVFTAQHAGPESNDIVVTATPDPGPPLTATIAVSAVETDSYGLLDSAKAAALAIGVDAPTGNAGDPAAGTGVVEVEQSSVATGTTLPADHQKGVLTSAGFEVKAADNSVLFTLLPRADYAGSGGLSVSIDLDPSGTTFTVEAIYDSTKEAGPQANVTILTLGALPHPVAYLVSATAPPAGAEVPAGGSVQLSGGGPGLAATGLFYTS
jgi:hypothetical protein